MKNQRSEAAEPLVVGRVNFGAAASRSMSELRRVASLNPVEAAHEIKRLRDALVEMLGSYEALARQLDVLDHRPLDQTMNWDGPICARRALGRDERFTQAAPQPPKSRLGGP